MLPVISKNQLISSLKGDAGLRFGSGSRAFGRDMGRDDIQADKLNEIDDGHFTYLVSRSVSLTL